MRRKAHSANVPLDPVLIGLRKSCFSRIVIAKERVARLRQSGDITVTKLFKQVGGFTKSLITGSNGTLVALVSLHKKTARPEWTRRLFGGDREARTHDLMHVKHAL